MTPPAQTTVKEITRSLRIVVVDTAVDHIKLVYAKFDDDPADAFSHAYVHADNIKKTVKKMKGCSIPNRHNFTPVNVKNNKKSSYTTSMIVGVSNHVTEYELYDRGVFGTRENWWEPSSFGEEFPDNHNMYYFVGYDNKFYRVSDGKETDVMIEDFLCTETENDRKYYYKIENIAKHHNWIEITDKYYVPGNGDTIQFKMYLTSDEHTIMMKDDVVSYKKFEYVCNLKGVKV